jgi:hypothetical protein
VQLWKVVGHLSVSIRPCTNLNLRWVTTIQTSTQM